MCTTSISFKKSTVLHNVNLIPRIQPNWCQYQSNFYPTGYQHVEHKSNFNLNILDKNEKCNNCHTQYCDK